MEGADTDELDGAGETREEGGGDDEEKVGGPHGTGASAIRWEASDDKGGDGSHGKSGPKGV